MRTWLVVIRLLLLSFSCLQQCAVEFEIKAFSAESQDAKVRKR